MFRKLVKKYYQKLRIIIYKRLNNNKRVKGDFKKLQPVILLGNGSIFFGNNVNLGYFPSPFFYNGVIHLEARGESSSIIFGDNIFANNNLTIVCEGSRIEIGNKVLIGTNVEIIDSDFHGINPNERNSGNHICKPVKIGRNVFIGSNVKILKGVTIGDNSIVANSAVVVSSFPSNVIIGGNPAIIIKNLEE